MSNQDYDNLIYNTAIDESLSPLLATLMVAHANLESGSYTSNIFETCNNAFGYKYVGQSLATQCTGSPEGDNYAAYASVEDSAREVARWIKRRQSQFDNVQTADDYATVLKNNGYYGATLSSYKAALNKLWLPVKSMMNMAITKYPEASLITGLTFFSLLTYYVIRIAKKK